MISYTIKNDIIHITSEIQLITYHLTVRRTETQNSKTRVITVPSFPTVVSSSGQWPQLCKHRVLLQSSCQLQIFPQLLLPTFYDRMQETVRCAPFCHDRHVASAIVPSNTNFSFRITLISHLKTFQIVDRQSSEVFSTTAQLRCPVRSS